jgi:putative ABC transport system substrate-binding protein
MNRMIQLASRYLPIIGLLVCTLLLPGLARAAGKKVMIITNRGCEEICRSFEQGLQSQGEISLIVRDIAGDTKKVPAIIDEARAMKVDLIATWGTGVTLAVIGKRDAVDPAKHVTDIPVVYLFVGNPVESGIAVDTKRSGRPNVAGANTTVPVEAQINLMMSYRKVSRVGMIFNVDEPAAVLQAASVRKQFEARSVAVSVVELPKGLDGKADPESIEPGIERLAQDKPEFIYYIGSSFTLANSKRIGELAMQRGIPVFTGFEQTYRKGSILLGLTSPLTGIGQIGAYQAGQILFNDRKPGDLNSPTLTRHSVLINMDAARQLKAYPPMKLLQFAELTN